jgi:hypothetical protein
MTVMDQIRIQVPQEPTLRLAPAYARSIHSRAKLRAGVRCDEQGVPAYLEPAVNATRPFTSDSVSS